MTRLTHIMLLLLSLAVIVLIGINKPGSIGETGVAVEGQIEKGEVPEQMSFNLETPDTLPDLNQGYVFVQERELVESDFDLLNKGDTKEEVEETSAADLEEVLYAGSVIIGDLRKALVSYPSVETTVKKDAKGRVRSKGRAVEKHEQLEQGGEFMGFLVATIEEDRIVFERDGETVEKFLHDQNKKRIIVKRTVKEPSGNQATEGKAAAPGSTGQPENTTERQKAEPPKDLPQRRSERLLRGMMSSPGMSSLMPPPATSGSQ